MTDNIEDEVDAIKVILKALEPLPPDARVSVVHYVTKRLGISAAPEPALSNQSINPISTPTSVPAPSSVHLKEFAKQKNPRSANEMAAIVAYYLAELAPIADRKSSVTADDVRTYFKIGEFPLPDVRFTLPNAKAAGYFDALGSGQYQLNAVGHNLVAHSLPRSAGKTASTNRSRKKAR